MTEPLEKVIERRVSEAARARGWATYKFTSPGNRAVPDRLFLRNGDAFFIEFKRRHKLPSLAQQREHDKIRARGFAVFVVDSVECGLALLDRIAADGVQAVAEAASC